MLGSPDSLEVVDTKGNLSGGQSSGLGRGNRTR